MGCNKERAWTRLYGDRDRLTLTAYTQSSIDIFFLHYQLWWFCQYHEGLSLVCQGKPGLGLVDVARAEYKLLWVRVLIKWLSSARKLQVSDGLNEEEWKRLVAFLTYHHHCTATFWTPLSPCVHSSYCLSWAAAGLVYAGTALAACPQGCGSRTNGWFYDSVN